MTKIKLCLVTEKLHHPIDEGFKKIIASLFAAIRNNTNAYIMGRDISSNFGINYNINRFYLNSKFIKDLQNKSPSHILYFPSASLTIGSFVRAKCLSFFTKTHLILFGFQPRRYSLLSHFLIKWLKPGHLFVQSKKSYYFYTKLGMKVSMLRSGVDTNKFIPVDFYTKMNLRELYHIPKEKKIILHIGHLKNTRALQDLLELEDANSIIVIVVSSSTIQDKKLGNILRQRGVIIINDFVENIEHYYQMSDVYVFPTKLDNAAIEFPLTILEALSCGIPVLTTPFGGLPDFLSENDQLRFFYSNIDAKKKMKELFNNKLRMTSKRLVDINYFSWDVIAIEIIDKILGLK